MAPPRGWELNPEAGAGPRSGGRRLDSHTVAKTVPAAPTGGERCATADDTMGAGWRDGDRVPTTGRETAMARRSEDDGGLQAELERLHALPPAAFTAARNQLAARLKHEGRQEAAAAVKALPRPTPSAWAVTRLLRLEPVRFQALLAAGKQARQAQRQVLSGGAGPAAAAAAAARLREALREARALVEELRRRGLALLAAGGRAAAAPTPERLAADLQALAFTAGAESAIARGWLEQDLDAPGFAELAGLQAAAGRAAAARGGKSATATGKERVAGKEHPPGGAPAGNRGVRRKRPGGESDGERERSVGRGRLAGEPPVSGAAAALAGPRRLPVGRSPAVPPLPEPAAPSRRQQPARERQEQVRRERERARLREARDRDRARLAAAEAAVRDAAAESTRLEAAADAAERAAAAARRQAAETAREAERARRGAEQARQRHARERERLVAVRAAAERGLRSAAAAAAESDETR